MKALALEALTLGTPRGRLAAILIITALVYVAPYAWLGHLSLWAALGWHSAPSIGLTRAYWLLLHGRPEDAWHRNRLIYPVLMVLIPLLINDLLMIYRSHHSRVR